MNSEKLVSVVLPTYNREKEIYRSLASVLNQTYQNLEVLVVDDERTEDNTEEAVKSFDDERVEYLVHGTGVSEARNKGIEKSSGDYIAFIDSDDVWFPENLEEKIMALDIQDGQMAVSKFQKVFLKEKKKKIGKPFFQGMTMKKSVLKGHTVPPSTAVFSREVFDEIGFFDENLDIWEDSDMWVRTIEKFGEPVFVDEVLVKYFMHEESVSSRAAAEELAENLERFIEKHSDILEETGLMENALEELKGFREKIP